MRPAPERTQLACLPAVLTLALAAVATAQEGPPAQNAAAEQSPELTVLFWYDRARPLDTFQYRTYDNRKNEFGAAVRSWLDTVHRSYPRYEAYTQPVFLSREKGETEALKTGQVILREFIVIGTANGYVFAPPGAPRVSASAPKPVRITPPAARPSPGWPAPVPPSPFPFPIPRPFR
jgi:hypothetical protein